MSDDAIGAIARAVLYEGHVLWPYRRSALKNRQRWTIGGVYPETFSIASGGTDRCTVGTACLLQAAADAHVRVSARFLHVVRRRVARRGQPPDHHLAFLEEAVVGGVRHLSWDEATEREVELPPLALGTPDARVFAPVELPGDEQTEPLGVADGAEHLLVRDWEPLHGTLSAWAEPLAPGRWRLHAQLANDTPWDGTDRDGAIRRTLVAAHLVLHCDGGAFVSAMDPPAELRDESARCEQRGLWPVLAGTDGGVDTMLAAPMILYDHPRIAPESVGDLFDAGEIEQLLVLNILGLTEEEQREMSDSDPRAREILERCRALTPEQLLRLNGAVRELRLPDEPLLRGGAPDGALE